VIHLHTESAGTGPTILFAHGFAGSARNWNPHARTLKPTHRVLRYDARGHARSDAPDDPTAYTPDTFVDDMSTVLGTTEDAIVAGLSMGASTALRFALQHPDKTRALILAAFPSGPDRRSSFTALAHAFADAIERDGIDKAGQRFVWGPDSGLDPAAARLVRQGFLEHPSHGLAHTLRGVIARQPRVDDLKSQLQNLRIPTLVIVGANDEGSLDPSHALKAAIPDARLVTIPDAGHVVNLAAPAAFDAALLDFLTTLP
jgi:pimeloyl-ACP methyl ester carboxylesterase